MNIQQRIAKNTVSLLFSGLVAQFTGFCAIVYLARVLGPENFGKINFAIAVVAYFTLMTHLGLPLVGTREIARDRKIIGPYFTNIFLMRVAFSFVSFILLILFTLLLNKALEVKNLIFLYGIGVFVSAMMLDWIFQGIEKMEVIGLGRVISAFVYVGLVFLFIKNKEQFLLIPCFQVLGTFTAAMVLIALFLKGFGRPRFKFSLPLCRHIFLQSVPLGISIILIQVIYNVDTVMLGFMRTDAEIGYYNSAYRIILPLIMVGGVYFDAVFPVMSNYYQTSLASLEKLQFNTAKLMGIIALPLAFSGTFLALPIITLLYGPKYSHGVIPFQILIWAVALIYLNMIYARGMWACNRQNKYVKIVFAQALINIVLNFVLIPPFGIIGASVSTVAAELVGFFFYYRQFNKIVYVPIHKYLFKPFLASFGMLPILNFFQNVNVPLSLASAFLVYFLILYLIKGITKGDIKSMVGILVPGRAC
jgi:O-antigen/teichoic acid export membrane protein